MSDAELMSQLEALPQALRYGARQLQIRINRNTNIVPIGTDAVNSNGSGVVRFRMPSASILNLSTLSVSFVSTISGLNVGSGTPVRGYTNALIPAAYKYIRRAQFYLGGVSCAGSLCNNYNQVYHAFVKASVNKPYCHAKVGGGFTEVSDLYDQYGYLTDVPAGTSKTAFQVLDDFLLLAKANGASVNPDSMIDTSIWQDAELELNFDTNAILSVFAEGDPSTTNANTKANAVSWALSNIRLNIDAVSSIPAIYGAFMEARSNRPEPIRFIFQNLVSQVSQILQTTRVQLSSTCIDGLMICGLLSNQATPSAFVANVLANTTVVNATNNNKFNFIAPITVTNANDTNAYTGFNASIQVGTALYPTTPYNSAYLLADSTYHHFWHNSIMSSSLLYQQNVITCDGTTAAVEEYPYTQPTYITNQFIWVQSFSLEDGWASPNKILSGIDTSATNVDILVQTSMANASYSFLLVGLLSSVLEYDTQARRVRVIQ
jgi:hypothetical protein